MNGNIAKWGTLGLAALASIAYFGAGAMKVAGAEQMVQSFSSFGLPLWFLLFIGLCEVAGAIGLWLSPEPIRGWPLKRLAAAGLAIIMAGAVATHAIYDPLAMALPAAVLLAITLYLTYAFGRAAPVARAAAE